MDNKRFSIDILPLTAKQRVSKTYLTLRLQLRDNRLLYVRFHTSTPY